MEFDLIWFMIQPSPLKILKASAGSGKTFSLAIHYLTLLFSEDYKYREILAVTFTNKATEEMKTRILDVLRGIAQQDNSAEIESYRSILLASFPQYSPAHFQERADRIYRRIIHDYSRFSVSTIDGFVQKVIRSFSFELGLDSSYALEMNIDKVKNNLVERLELALDSNPALVNWIIRLAKERIDANKSWNYKSELLDLTSEIFKERFADFEQALTAIGLDKVDQIFQKLAKETKLAITQFEQQLVTYAEQVLALMLQAGITTDQLKGKSRSPLLILQKIKNKEFKDVQRLEKLIDQTEDWYQKGFESTATFEMNELIKACYTFYQQGLSNYILGIQFNKNVYYLRLMQEMTVLLKAYREESGNLLISDAQNLLSGITDDAGDNPSFIWEKIGNRYKNFLFDEFQDTSVAQWDSFKALVQNAIAEPSEDYIDHLIVGDTKQSIYRWRNGDWNILEKQAKIDLGPENIVDQNLTENYRSTTAIIDFNNQLYEILPEMIQEQLNISISETEQEELLTWWAIHGYHKIIPEIYQGAAQEITPYTKAGGSLKIKKFSKEDLQEQTFSEASLDFMIAEIQQLTQEHQYSYPDICVLVRTNSEALEVVKRLMEVQIPVVSGDALLISSNAAVNLIINCLQLLVGYQENSSLYKANCIALYDRIQGKEVDPNAYLHLARRSLSDLREVLPTDFIEQADQWMLLPLAELVEHIIRSFGLAEKPAYLPYLLAFRDIVGNASRQGERGILSFLNWWMEDGLRKTLPSPDGANAVQILTIHKSKGLAFRAVMIPFCAFELSGKSASTFWVPAKDTPYAILGSIPLKYSKELAKSSIAPYYFEEELYSHVDGLNMLYVATTRAKDYIYIGTKEKAETSKSTANIGDFINTVYADKFDAENLFSQEAYIYKVSKPKAKNRIALSSYPTSTRISEIFNPLEEKNINHLLNVEQAGRTGSILHDILAKVKNQAAIPDYVQELNIQGIILAEEVEKFITESQHVLNHEGLQELFAKAEQTLEEKGIIDSQGKQHRPDKILLCADELIILDYKFTLQAYQEHIDQVQLYKELCADMGYKNVKGYLFYAISKTLQIV